MLKLVFCKTPGGNGTYVIGRDVDETPAHPSGVDDSGSLITGVCVLGHIRLMCPFIVSILPVEKINDRIRFFREQKDIQEAIDTEKLVCSLPRLVPDELLLNSVENLRDYTNVVMEISTDAVLTSNVVSEFSTLGKAYDTTLAIWSDTSSATYKKAAQAMDFDVAHFIQALADPKERDRVIYHSGPMVQ